MERYEESYTWEDWCFVNFPSGYMENKLIFADINQQGRLISVSC